MPKKIEISHKTIIFTVLFLILIRLIYDIRDIIFLVFIATLISTILNPIVAKMSRFKIPRALTVIIVYILGVGLVGASIGTIINPLIEQSSNFAVNFPIFLEKLQIPRNIVDQVTTEITSEIGNISSQILKIGVSVFSNILTVLAVIIISLYLSIAREKISDQLGKMISEEKAKKVERVLSRLESELGGWTRAQLLLMLLVGVTTYLGLILLRIPYAIPLAVLASILEIIPNIGPVVAAVPAIIVGFGISPVSGFAVLALTFLVQQVENYLFVPKVMEKSAGINPVITLLTILVGLKLGGVVGAMLSVPILITIRVLLKEFFPMEKQDE